MWKELLKQKEEVIEIVKKENYQVYQHARWLNNVGHFPIYQAGAMKYFPLGEYFYEDLLEKIKNAKKFIFLEFFIRIFSCDIEYLVIFVIDRIQKF